MAKRRERPVYRHRKHNQMKDNLKVKVVWLLAMAAMLLVLGVVESVAAEPVTSAPLYAAILLIGLIFGLAVVWHFTPKTMKRWLLAILAILVAIPELLP